jgi:hypothetical protein
VAPLYNSGMKEGQHVIGRMKRMLNSKLTILVVAVLAVVMLCISATIAFGFGAFGSSEPLERMPTVTDNSPSTLKVVTTDDSDVANMAATLPSTEAAGALQSQNAASAPQSTVNEQQSAAGASLNAGSVSLQAPVVPGVNALNLDRLNLGL